MSYLKKFCLVLILTIVGICFVACGEDYKLSLQDSEIEIFVGSTYEIKPITDFDSPVFNYSIDNDVITIKDNVVTGAKVGVSTVTIEIKDYDKAKVTLKVNVVAKPELELNGASQGYVGDELTFEAVKSNLDGALVWDSSNKEVATVADGKVSCLAVGETTISVVCGELKKEIKLTVQLAPAIKLTAGKAYAGSDLKVEYELTNLEGTVVWSSSDETIATVNNGMVSCLKVGKVTITATIGSVSGTIELTVEETPSMSISGEKEIFVGKTTELTVTLVNIEGEQSWSSSDETIATVADGVVSGLKAGKVTITCTVGTYDADFDLEVKDNGEIVLNGDKLVYIGNTIKLTATLTNMTGTVEWSSSDEEVATVADGVVKGLKAGKVTITAKCGDKEAKAEVEVQELPTIVLEYNGTLYVDDEGEVIAKLTNLEGKMSLSSSDESVLTITEVDGKIIVKALKDGKATIKAQIGDVFCELEITVLPKPVITYTGELVVNVNKELTLTFVVAGLTETVEWTSSDTNIATCVDGVVKGMAAGSVEITAKLGKYTAKVTIEVQVSKYTVKFIGNDGKVISEVIVEEGKAAEAPAAPVISGYEFDAWDKDFSNVTSDLEVKALYNKTSKIKYVLGGGVLPQGAPTTFVKGNDVTLPIPTKDGYRFLGWSKIKGSKTYITEVGSESADVTIYANWTTNGANEKYQVGPLEDYTSISQVLAIAKEGAVITCAAGTYSEAIDIKLNNITLIGPNAEINAATGERSAEAKITGKVTVAEGLSNISICGFEFNGSNVVVFGGKNSKITFNNNIAYGKISTSGTTTNMNSVVSVNGNVKDLVVKGNKFTLDSSNGNTCAFQVTGKASNADIRSNYFTDTCTDSANVFALVLRELSGDIYVNENNFYRFAGNYWTVWLASGSAIDKNTIIEFNNNNIDGGSSDTCCCGIAIDGLTSDSMYLFFIGNTISYCKDTVLGFKGTGSSDSASKPNVKIMYNKFLNTSTTMRFGMNAENFYFGNNYKFQAFSNQGTPTIDAKAAAQNDYETEAELDTAYETYKQTPLNMFGKISYETNGGTVSGSSRYVFGKETVLPTPTYEGNTFLGWSLTPESTEYISVIPSTQKDDVTVYAHWMRLISFDITYNFDGGVSTELYVASGNPAVQFEVDNYNYNNGSFWGENKYATDVHIGNSGSDPTATFSDRIYIGKDSVSGLYKIINILTSGASSWPDGAEYVITISSSCSKYGTINPLVHELTVGQILAFSKPINQITKDDPATVYFYTEAPTGSSVTVKITSNDSLIVPSKLGYKFLGWFDDSNKLYSSILDVTGNISLTAKWEQLSPVTDIVINSSCTEMITFDTFQIEAKVAPDDAFFKDLYYTTDNPDVVNVDKNGLLTAVNTGTAKITITDYMKKVVKELVITVYPITSLDVTFGEGYTGVLEIGGTVQVNPAAFGKEIGTPTFSFKSSNEAIATVSATGLVEAKGLGTATITISDDNALTSDLEIAVFVDTMSDASSVEKILSLLKENNFAVVQTGNVSLYNDGRDRVYDSMYGSVNNFLFDDFLIDTTYCAAAEANANCHRDRRPTDQIEFVTVHDTATLTGTVESIGSVMSSGETSIHYTVGNDKILAVVPEKYIAYHAGDGTGTPFTWIPTGVKAENSDKPKIGITQVGSAYYFTVNGTTSSVEAPITDGSKTIANPDDGNLPNLGPVWKVVDGQYYIGNSWVCFSQQIKGIISSHGGNNNSIGIEMCVSYSSDIYDTYQRTAKLVADILIRNNLDLTRVQQHNTWSGKGCPQTLIAGGNWDDFMKMVALNYEIMKNYPDAKISMVSNNPTIVDNTGRVINAPKTTTTVSYDVTVTVGSEQKTITLSSVVPGSTTWEQWDGTYPSKLIWNGGKYAR